MSRESAMNLVKSAPVVAPPVAPIEGVNEAPAEVDTQAPADVTPKAPEPLESTRFAHLAKKEAMLVKEREAFKLEQKQIAEEKEKLKDIQTKINEFEATKAQDPIKALKILGFSETDLYNFMAQAEDKSTPEEKAQKIVQSEVQKLKDELAAKETKLQEEQSSKVLSSFKGNISKAVVADKEKYEFCNFHGAAAEELIFATVESVYEESGGKEILTASQAADLVEAYYEEQVKSMSTLKKMQPKEAIQEIKQKLAEAPKDEPLRAEVSPRPKTLTSKETASLSSTIKKTETPAEKRARLIEALRNIKYR